MRKAAITALLAVGARSQQENSLKQAAIRPVCCLLHFGSLFGFHFDPKDGGHMSPPKYQLTFIEL
jgi:hypothetical protein